MRHFLPRAVRLSRVMADVSADMPDDGVIVRGVACPERTCALIVGLGMADCKSCLRDGCSLCGLLNGESTATCRLPTSLCAGKPCPTKVIA